LCTDLHFVFKPKKVDHPSIFIQYTTVWDTQSNLEYLGLDSVKLVLSQCLLQWNICVYEEMTNILNYKPLLPANCQTYVDTHWAGRDDLYSLKSLSLSLSLSLSHPHPPTHTHTPRLVSEDSDSSTGLLCVVFEEASFGSLTSC